MKRIAVVVTLCCYALALVAPSHARLGFTFAWPAGHRWIYQLAWSSRDRVAVGGTSFTGDTQITGEVALRSYGAGLVGISLSPERAELHVLGQAVAPELADHEAIARIAPSGEIRELMFADGDPAVFVAVVQTLAGELSLHVPAEPAASWEADARDSLGAVHARYAAEDSRTLARHRTYTSLLAGTAPDIAVDSTDRFTLAGGAIAALDSKNHVTAGALLEHDATLIATLVRVETVPSVAIDLTGRQRREIGVPIVTPDVRAKLLAQRVAGMTAEQLVGDLYTHARGGLHDDHRWFWRASGLLVQDPAACDELATAFADAEMSTETRGVILDLLASAGHARAQAALRSALATATGDREYPMYLQRLALVAHPEPDTIATLERVLAAPDREVAAAGELAYGAALRRIDPSIARGKVAPLVAALGGPDRATALRALGNTALPEVAPRILAARTDPDPVVRAAAASALRAMPDATDALLELAADRIAGVGAEALQSLASRPLDDRVLDGLDHLIADRRIAAENDPSVVNLVATRLDDPRAVKLLEAELARTTDVRLAARLRTLLGASTNPLSKG